MAYSVMELTTVLANLAPGRHRGGSCARPGAASRGAALESSFDRGPYANSRTWLTEDRKLHSGRRGDVLSTWIPTVLGMTLQCLGWRHGGGDGRTGPEVTEKTCPAGPTPRRHPGRARSWWPYLFRGCCRPLSRGTTWRYGSRRLGTMCGSRTGGWSLPGVMSD
jgi:hypothetical protein